MLLEGQKVLVAAAVSLLRMHKSKQSMHCVTYLRMCTFVCVSVHVQSGLVSVRICTRTYVNVRMYIYVRTYIFAHVCTHVCTYVCMVCMCTYVHTYMHMYCMAENFGRLLKL